MGIYPILSMENLKNREYIEDFLKYFSGDSMGEIGNISYSIHGKYREYRGFAKETIGENRRISKI